MRECSGKRQLRDAKLQQLAHALCSLELNLGGTELGSLVLFTPDVNVVGGGSHGREDHANYNTVKYTVS